MCKLKLLTAKTYRNFVRIDQFLRDLYPKQIDKQTNFKLWSGDEINNGTWTNILKERQTLQCYIATKLTMVPKWKRDILKKKIIKVKTFVQKLLWNETIICRKIREKIVKKIFEKIAPITSQKPSPISFVQILKM